MVEVRERSFVVFAPPTGDAITHERARGANFLVHWMTATGPGEYTFDDAEESLVITPMAGDAVSLQRGDASADLTACQLAVVAEGPTTVRFAGPGRCIRLTSSAPAEEWALATNAADYAGRDARVDEVGPESSRRVRRPCGSHLPGIRDRARVRSDR